MNVVDFSMSIFREIEPQLKKYYGIDRFIISEHINSSIDNNIALKDARFTQYVKDNNVFDMLTYAMDTLDKFKILVSDEYCMEEFNQFCMDYSVDNISKYILEFMYILTMNRREKYTTSYKEMEMGYWEYVHDIRPEMLELYIALQKNHLSSQCKITIGNDKPVVIDKQVPWVQIALEKYLKKYLGVDSLKDAERELRTIYGKSVGVPLDKEETRYMWGTYQLLQTISSLKSKKTNSVTNKQSRFITDFLILNKMINLKDADSINIRVRLKYFLKSYNSLEDLLHFQSYKTSPNNPDTKYGIYF